MSVPLHIWSNLALSVLITLSFLWLPLCTIFILKKKLYGSSRPGLVTKNQQVMGLLAPLRASCTRTSTTNPFPYPFENEVSPQQQGLLRYLLPSWVSAFSTYTSCVRTWTCAWAYRALVFWTDLIGYCVGLLTPRVSVCQFLTLFFIILFKKICNVFKFFAKIVLPTIAPAVIMSTCEYVHYVHTGRWEYTFLSFDFFQWTKVISVFLCLPDIYKLSFKCYYDGSRGYATFKHTDIKHAMPLAVSCLSYTCVSFADSWMSLLDYFLHENAFCHIHAFIINNILPFSKGVTQSNVYTSGRHIIETAIRTDALLEHAVTVIRNPIDIIMMVGVIILGCLITLNVLILSEKCHKKTKYIQHTNVAKCCMGKKFTKNTLSATEQYDRMVQRNMYVIHDVSRDNITLTRHVFNKNVKKSFIQRRSILLNGPPHVNRIVSC